MDEIIRLARYSITAPFPGDRKLALDSLKDRLREEPANGGADGLSLIFSIIAKEQGDEGICNAALSYVIEQRSLQDIAEHASLWSIRVSAAERLNDTELSQLVYDEAARKAEDPSVRRQAVSRLDVQETLTEIAQNDDCLEVRLTALGKLTNQAALAQIIRDSNDLDVCRVALGRLETQDSLDEVALRARSSRIRILAADKLTNREWAFLIYDEIAKTAADSEARQEAECRLSERGGQLHPLPVVANDESQTNCAEVHAPDQESLSQIAIGGDRPRDRLAAVIQLTNQTVLARVAINDGNEDVSFAAYSKLTDRACFSNVAQRARCARVCKAALERVDDQGVLENVVRHHQDFGVRRIAVERVANPAVLASVAQNDATVVVRRAAVNRLGDQNVLASIARNESDGEVSLLAYQKLADTSQKIDFAKNARSAQVRKAALEGLTDQTGLANVALHAGDEEIRHMAVERLTDQAALAKVVINDVSSDVRKVAFARLSDQAALTAVARNAAISEIRCDAVSRLIDQAALGLVSRRDRNPDVRLAAVKRLTDQTGLANVALEDHDVDVRLAAVERLTDQSVLANVVLKDCEASVRCAAIVRTTGQDVLAMASCLDHSREVVWEAVTRLDPNNQNAIESRNDRIARVQRMALPMIDRPEFLMRLVEQSPVPWIRLEALGALVDSASLDKVARNPEVDTCVRLAAARRLDVTPWREGFIANHINDWPDDDEEACRGFAGSISRVENKVKAAIKCRFPSVSMEIVRSIDDQDAIHEIFTAAVNPEVRLLAFCRLDDPAIDAPCIKDDLCRTQNTSSFPIPWGAFGQETLVSIAMDASDIDAKCHAVLELTPDNLVKVLNANAGKEVCSAVVEKALKENLIMTIEDLEGFWSHVSNLCFFELLSKSLPEGDLREAATRVAEELRPHQNEIGPVETWERQVYGAAVASDYD